MSEWPSDRPRFSLGLCYIFLLTAVLAVVLVVRPYQWMNDDAYFYLKVALNHSRGLGSSFSGLAPTNGYHPLWQWFLFGLYDIAQPSIQSGLVLARLLSLAFMTLALLLVHRFALRAFNPAWAAATVALLSLMGTRGAYIMEFWPYAAALAALLCFGLRCTPTWRDGMLAGVLCAVAIFARLDGVVVAGCWIAALAVHFRQRINCRGAARFAVASVGVVAVFTALYAYHNHRTFGHAATISVLLKSTFPWPTFSGTMPARPTLLAWPGTFCGLLYLVWYARARPRDRSTLMLAVIALAAVVHLLFVQLFTRWPAFGIWWWAPAYLAAALGVGFAGFQLAARWWATGLIMAAAAWNALAIVDALVRFPDRPQGVTAAEFTAHLPKDAVIFQVDATGMTSYLADRTVINGDGLMNNLEYQHALAGGKLDDYFAQYGVTHVVHDEVEAVSPDVASGNYVETRLDVPCHLYGRTVVLHLPREWEVARWTVHWPGQWFPWPRHAHAQTFVVWRLPKSE